MFFITLLSIVQNGLVDVDAFNLIRAPISYRSRHNIDAKMHTPDLSFALNHLKMYFIEQRGFENVVCVWNCQEEIIFEMSAIEWLLKWSLMARIRRPFSRYRSLTNSSDLASLRYMSRSLLVGLTHTFRVYIKNHYATERKKSAWAFQPFLD